MEALRLTGESNLTKSFFWLVVLLILINYIIYVFVGTTIDGIGDSWFHIARITDILYGGFNVQSAYVHAFPELSYHYNVIYAFYVIPAKLFSYSTLWVWRYSLGFFNLMMLLASFSFAIMAFTKWVKNKKSSMILASASMFPVMAFFSYFAFVDNYPDRIVKIWEILLIICLSQKITKKNFKPILFILLGLAVVITMTQTLDAMVCAFFIITFAAIRLIIERKDFIKDKKSQLAYALTTIVLMIGPLVTKLVPIRMPSKLIENYDAIANFKIFGLTIMQPVMQNSEFIDWVLTASEVVAVIYLIFSLRKQKFNLSMVLSLVFFFAIFAFTPLCSVLNQFIPLWVITRFNNIPGIIGQIYLTVAVFIIIRYVSKLVVKKYPNLKKNADYKTILYAVLFITISAPSLIYINNYYRWVFTTDQDAIRTSYVNFAKDYQNILNDNKLVISNEGYNLTALFRIDILAAPYTHDVTASDSVDRSDCQNFILQNYDYADLQSVGAKYVVANDQDRTTYSLGNKPYLKLVSSDKLTHDFGNDKLFVYQFISSSKYAGGKVYGSCLIYQQNEKTW
jgi:hypothetical protein